ncbi:MAG: hypothetical protein AB1816_09905 [Bacillota bacterium]|nr:hypothetical protein [Bacillota bacterium]
MSVEGEVATAGPFPQLVSPRWVSAGKLVALVRHDGSESVVEFSRGDGNAWTGRTLLTLKEGSVPASFYLWDYLHEGKSILFTSVPEAYLWRYDIPSSAARSAGQEVLRVADGVLIFKVSPDHTRAVVYGPKDASMIDFRTGGTTPLPDVRSYEFPFTGHASSWSPDSSHYLYQVIVGPLKTAFGIVRADTGKTIRTVAPDDGCAFDAVWSPDGMHVAFLLLQSRSDEFAGPNDELIPPIAQRLGILNVRTGELAYLAVPQKLVYGLPVWSPAGDQVAFAAGTVQGSRQKGFQATTALYVASSSGKGWQVGPVTRETKGVRQVPRSWAPGGKALAFTSWRDDPRQEYTLGVVKASTGADGRLSWSGPVMLGDMTESVVWLDEHTLAGLTTRAGGGEIRVFSVEGSTVSTLEGPPVLYSDMALSPDGRYLAYTVVTPSGQSTSTVLRIRPAR